MASDSPDTPPASDGKNGFHTESEWFGFTAVPRGEKKSRVRGVFDSVAARYDVMNDLMSLGVHRAWKHHFVTTVNPRAGERILDVAGGTGDIAFRMLEHSQKRRLREDRQTATATSSLLPNYQSITAQSDAPSALVSVCDINHAMMCVGQDRGLDRGYVGMRETGGIEWICGDAEKLPIPDGSMNAYTIAYGLRNVSDIPGALAEARRVLKPGGRFFCLEFSHVVLPGLEKLYEAYSFQVLPRVGAMVAGDREAYQYLAESIRRFPKQPDLEELMREAGFSRVKHTNLSGGITAIHTGRRL